MAENVRISANRYFSLAKPGDCRADVFVVLARSCDDQIARMGTPKLLRQLGFYK